MKLLLMQESVSRGVIVLKGSEMLFSPVLVSLVQMDAGLYF